MLRRGIAADRPKRLRTKAARLVEAVLTAEGAVSADALRFQHRSDRDRRRGAEVLRRLGYRLPVFLLR